MVATRVTRCAGAATAAGLLALVIRLVLIRLFDGDMLQVAAWIVALLPLLAIDVWAWYCSASPQDSARVAWNRHRRHRRHDCQRAGDSRLVSAARFE